MITLEIFVQSKAQNFKGGQTIFRQGDPGELMYVISAGTVEVSVDTILVETAGPGSVIGEMSMIDRRPRSASAKAKTACTLLPIDRKGFESLIARTPAFALEVMRIVVDRLRRADVLMASLKAKKNSQKK